MFDFVVILYLSHFFFDRLFDSQNLTYDLKTIQKTFVQHIPPQNNN